MTTLPVELQSLLQCLRDVEEIGDGTWRACCPGHPDSTPSLHITLDGDRILIYDFGKQCPAEVIMAAIGKSVRDLFITSDAATGPLTLAAFAHAKGFTTEFLTNWGVREDPKGLIFTYCHEDGRPALRHRRRTALRADDGSTWTGKPKGPLVPYGLPQLAHAREFGYVVIAEGETSALSAWAHGIPTLGVPGATLVKLLTREMLTGIPHLLITQDPDAAGEAFVHRLAHRLFTLLEWTGTAAVVRFPAGIGDLNDLHRLAGDRFDAEWRRAVEQATPLAPPTLHPYTVHRGQICRFEVDDLSHVPLCNFTATIVEEQLRDNGLTVARTFGLEGRLASGESLPRIHVPSEEFGALQWIPRDWGARAIVAAGPGARDQLREALQHLSDDVHQSRVFTHTGWRQDGDTWQYLSGAGAVGAEAIDVTLPPALARYRLPPTPTDVEAAMRTSLRLLSVAPLSVTVPLWGAVFRAPLAAFCPADVTLWLEGQSGSLKSTLAALFLCHYGAFERTQLPESWESTANALEERAFVLKDMLLVIDDYAPEGVKARDFHTKATRLIRSTGNASGRGRLKADLSEATTFFPRGLLLATGEQHPPGESIRARLYLVDVVREQIDLQRLTAAQRATACLPHALAGYVQWLAGKDAVRASLRDRFLALRGLAQAASQDHLRSPEGLAHLFLGFETGLLFAETAGACTAAERKRWHAAGWAALTAGAATTARDVAEAAPVKRFLTVLAMLLRQRRVTLGTRESDDTAPIPGSRPDAYVEMVGWLDPPDHLALIPDAAFTVVAQACRESGEPFVTTKNRLMKSLAESGLTTCDAGRTTTVIEFSWLKYGDDGTPLGKEIRRVRVLAVKRRDAELLIGEQFPC